VALQPMKVLDVYIQYVRANYFFAVKYKSIHSIRISSGSRDSVRYYKNNKCITDRPATVHIKVPKK